MKLTGEEREKWLALLHDIAFFEGFETRDLERLLDAGEVVHYALHQYIFAENDLDLSFFVILKGSVNILKLGPLNKKKNVAVLNVGDCFGEIGMLLEERRMASVLAAKECYIFKINSDNINNMPESAKANLYRRLAESLGERLANSTRSLVGLGQF